MDFSDILAEKDAEILSLRAEIAELKSKLEEKDLEEFEFQGDVSDEEEPMVLKLPDEYQEENPNLFQDPNTFMQFMQLMMNNNLQMSQDEEDGVENEDTKNEEELEYTQDENEEMPELEIIDDIIPE
jgi:hypothetical protein